MIALIKAEPAEYQQQLPPNSLKSVPYLDLPSTADNHSVNVIDYINVIHMPSSLQMLYTCCACLVTALSNRLNMLPGIKFESHLNNNKYLYNDDLDFICGVDHQTCNYMGERFIKLFFL